MRSKESLFEGLPDRFDREAFISSAIQEGYSYSYANSMILEFIHSGKLQRIERGTYRKSKKQ